MSEPRLLFWLQQTADHIDAEPQPDGHGVGVYVSNEDRSERALMAICGSELEAELVAAALRCLAGDVPDPADFDAVSDPVWVDLYEKPLGCLCGWEHDGGQTLKVRRLSQHRRCPVHR